MDKISTTSTSLSVVWAPPPRESVNGEFLGYEMTYHRQDGNGDGGGEATRVVINEDVMRTQVR